MAMPIKLNLLPAPETDTRKKSSYGQTLKPNLITMDNQITDDATMAFGRVLSSKLVSM